MKTKRTIKFNRVDGSIKEISELFGNHHIPKPEYKDLIQKKKKGAKKK